MEELDDEQRALIPHAQNELTVHCIYKGLQFGPTVALATALPYQLYRSKKTLSLRPILSRVGTVTIYGTIASVIASVAMMHETLTNGSLCTDLFDHRRSDWTDCRLTKARQPTIAY